MAQMAGAAVSSPASSTRAHVAGAPVDADGAAGAAIVGTDDERLVTDLHRCRPGRGRPGLAVHGEVDVDLAQPGRTARTV